MKSGTKSSRKESLAEWYDLLRQKAGALSQTGNSASAAFLEFELSGIKTIIRKIGKLRGEEMRRSADKAYPQEGGQQ